MLTNANAMKDDRSNFFIRLYINYRLLECMDWFMSDRVKSLLLVEICEIGTCYGAVCNHYITNIMFLLIIERFVIKNILNIFLES